MSSTPISSSGISAGSSITNSGKLLQITGLASGLDTNSIVSALLSDQTQRITNLTNQQTQLKSLNGLLSSIQSNLRSVALNAQALGDPGLFSSGESVTSSNAALVSATTAVGAAIGGHQMTVSQLASSASRTFTFSSPSTDDTVRIDGNPTPLSAKATISDFISAINSDPNATVFAATTGDGKTVVLSSRTTGDTSGTRPPGVTFIQTSDTGGALTQVLDSQGNAVAREGANAKFNVDGVDGTSSTNTVTNAIAGTTLALGGATPTGSPVTVLIGAPQANTSAIDQAVTTFVNAYNSIIDQVTTQTTQTTSKSNANQGLLFGDNELTGLLSNMRTTMYTPDTTLTKGFQSLADIGITTGAAAGSSPFSQDSVSGKLTIDTTALNNAIQTNPDAVKAMLQSWSNGFANVVNAQAEPGGSMDARVNGDNSQISNIGDQITNLNTMLSARQTALQAQFAALEATLGGLQSQQSWLSSQINSLPLPGLL